MAICRGHVTRKNPGLASGATKPLAAYAPFKTGCLHYKGDQCFPASCQGIV